MPKTKPKGYWDYYPHVEQAAIECGAASRSDLQLGHMTAYQAARRHKISPDYSWLDHLAARLKWPKKVAQGHWTHFDNHVKDIWECRAMSLADWGRHSPSAVSAAYKHGFIEDLLDMFQWEPGLHNLSRKKREARHPYGTLKDREYVLKVANQCDTWTDFIRNESSAYNSAVRYGFMEYVKANTTAQAVAVPREYWKSLSNCFADIEESGATSMQEWREWNGRGYRGSLLWGHHDVIYETTGWERRAEDGHWRVFENIIADIDTHGDTCLQAFRIRNTTAYLQMQEMGWERRVRLRYGWSKSVESSVLSTYVYQYIHGKRIYIGITVDPEGRHKAHMVSPYAEVRDLANTVQPTYYERLVEYKGSYEPYAMDRDTALITERRLIKCASAQGYEVTNRRHNPQFVRGRYVWKAKPY